MPPGRRVKRSGSHAADPRRGAAGARCVARDHVDRDTIEEWLEQALTAESLGEVTGAGTGSGVASLDVEVRDRKRGVALVQRVLEEHGLPASTCINDPEI